MGKRILHVELDENNGCYDCSFCEYDEGGCRSGSSYYCSYDDSKVDVIVREMELSKDLKFPPIPKECPLPRNQRWMNMSIGHHNVDDFYKE